MKILLTGASGSIGQNVLRYLPGSYEVHAVYNQRPLDISNARPLDITIEGEVLGLAPLQPDVIIHCAALTNFRVCEENAERAHIINVCGTRHVAQLARATRAKLVYISTDAVFDGKKGQYTEEDTPSATTTYGKTKQLGELEALSWPNTLVIRSNLFATGGRSFIDSILDCCERGEHYKAFTDAFNSPIYVHDWLNALLQLVERDEKGIFHVGSQERFSKYAFATQVAQMFGYDSSSITPGSREDVEMEYPRDLSLDTSKLQDVGVAVPSLTEMLQKFRNERPSV